MARSCGRWILATLLTGLTTTVAAQQLEREPPPKGEANSPYLATSIDFAALLAPPPEVGSLRDHEDERAAEYLQSVSEERWRAAELDSELVYPRFEDAFGKPLDRRTSPILVHLLNRALRDVAATTFAAKDHFKRPRPFQRIQLHRVCGEAAPPKPEPHPMGGSSYPSGHSAYGWTVAMILSRIAPERAEALMARAADYAESRVICGVHFPSDVDAGQVIATAVVVRLDDSSDFQADLARARAEYSAH